MDKQQKKPTCKLCGENGNIYNLIGIASKTLKEKGMHDKSVEMKRRIFREARNYEDVLGIIGEYVEIE